MAGSRVVMPIMILGLFCSLSVGSTAQNLPSIPDDEGFRPSRYDGAHETLFFGSGILRRDSKPIRAYDINGTRRGADINIFKDFPALDHAVIDDAAAGPDGKTVIAAVLNFGSKTL